MRKKLLIVIFMFTLFFSVSKNVFAECSYDIRKQLLEETKKVNVSMETIKNGNDNYYSFKYIISNLSENIFVKYYNTNNGIENYIHYSNTENGIFSFIDTDSFNIYDYNFIFYSDKDECLAEKISSSKIKKPMYNTYSENINCTFENNKNFKYCKQFLDNDYKITNAKFYDELNKYNISLSSSIKNDQNEIKQSFFQKYKKVIFITIPIFVIIVITICLITYKKKKLYNLE